MTYIKPRVVLTGDSIGLVQGQPTTWNVCFKLGGCADMHPQLENMFFIATPNAYEADE